MNDPSLPNRTPRPDESKMFVTRSSTSVLPLESFRMSSSTFRPCSFRAAAEPLDSPLNALPSRPECFWSGSDAPIPCQGLFMRR